MWRLAKEGRRPELAVLRAGPQGALGTSQGSVGCVGLSSRNTEDDAGTSLIGMDLMGRVPEPERGMVLLGGSPTLGLEDRM